MTSKVQTPNPPSLAFDRRVSAELESALSASGSLRSLVDLALADQRMDVQLRRRTLESWVSFYCGLTSILDVVEKGGQLRFKAHPTHRVAGTFVDEWSSAIPIEAAEARVADVAAYLKRMLGPGKVNPRYTATEGAVQTSISRFKSPDFGVFQREAVAFFPSVAIRDQLVEPFQSRIWSAIKAANDQPPWWPGIRDRGKPASPGLETDLLGIDSAGRLLVIEVKPSAALKGLTWAPGQVRLYAEIMATWLDQVANAPSLINAMVDQRGRIGLATPSHHVPTDGRIRIVPVVAVGPTTPSAGAFTRMKAVHTALQKHPPLSPAIDSLEIWEHDGHGKRVDVTVL